MKAMMCLHCLLLLGIYLHSALGLAQRRGLRQNPTEVKDEQECSLNASIPQDLTFGFNLDMSFADKPTDKEAAELKSAIKDYKKAQTTMQQAQNRLLNAMTAMLEVPQVDGNALTKLMESKEKDVLVVFYAPWCGHCQRFVIHDGKGNPEKAPLEVFNRDVSEAAGETLKIVRFDVQQDKASIPSSFTIQAIPSIFIVPAGGNQVQFKGNHLDPGQLKHFIQEHAAKTKGLVEGGKANNVPSQDTGNIPNIQVFAAKTL
jgi:thioredoxin-like negative regulator of GroEL